MLSLLRVAELFVDLVREANGLTFESEELRS